MTTIIIVCALYLIGLGFFCFIAKHNLFKIIIGFNLISSGIILLLIVVGHLEGGSPPVIDLYKSCEDRLFVDPLPQAMALTSIVIGAGITAISLSLLIKMHRSFQTLNITEIAGRASK